VREAVMLRPDLELSAGLRYDAVLFDVGVITAPTADESGSRTFDQLSPTGGTVPTPAVRDGAMRYSLIGDQLLGVTSATVQVTAPPSTPTSTSSVFNTEPPTVGLLAGESATAAPPVETVQVRDLSVAWTKSGALGLPAVVGDQLLMPVSGGLSVFDGANGNAGIAGSIIPVDRGGYRGRVDAAAVGTMIIETRGDLVVGLSATT